MLAKSKKQCRYTASNDCHYNLERHIFNSFIATIKAIPIKLNMLAKIRKINRSDNHIKKKSTTLQIYICIGMEWRSLKAAEWRISSEGIFNFFLVELEGI